MTNDVNTTDIITAIEDRKEAMLNLVMQDRKKLTELKASSMADALVEFASYEIGIDLLSQLDTEVNGNYDDGHAHGEIWRALVTGNATEMLRTSPTPLACAITYKGIVHHCIDELISLFDMSEDSKRGVYELTVGIELECVDCTVGLDFLYVSAAQVVYDKAQSLIHVEYRISISDYEDEIASGAMCAPYEECAFQSVE